MQSNLFEILIFICSLLLSLKIFFQPYLHHWYHTFSKTQIQARELPQSHQTVQLVIDYMKVKGIVICCQVEGDEVIFSLKQFKMVSPLMNVLFSDCNRLFCCGQLRLNYGCCSSSYFPPLFWIQILQVGNSNLSWTFCGLLSCILKYTVPVSNIHCVQR